jgi:hypothetical protein
MKKMQFDYKEGRPIIHMSVYKEENSIIHVCTCV